MEKDERRGKLHKAQGACVHVCPERQCHITIGIYLTFHGTFTGCAKGHYSLEKEQQHTVHKINFTSSFKNGYFFHQSYNLFVYRDKIEVKLVTK